MFSRNQLSIFLMLAPAISLADISYIQKIDVQASGGMSVFESSGEVLTQISGDRSRTESDIAMKSTLLGMFGNSGKSGSIVRLDKGLSWTLQPEEQTYREMTFAEVRAQIADSEDAAENLSSSQESSLPVSDSSCSWSQPQVKVEKPGEKSRVASIRTRKHVVRVEQTCSMPESGRACDVSWVVESWMAKRVPAEKEARAFRESYQEALALGELSQPTHGPGHALISMFADNWDEVAEELGKIEGYPLKTIMQMEIGGEQCTTQSGQPIAMDSIWGDASTAAYNAAVDSTGGAVGSATGQAAAEALGEGVGANVGGAAIGAATNEIIGGLTGMFRKEKKPEPQPAPAQASPGKVTVFKISNEVTSWTEATIPAERFEEPAGWKKL
jgi:hypothetical protein